MRVIPNVLSFATHVSFELRHYQVVCIKLGPKASIFSRILNEFRHVLISRDFYLFPWFFIHFNKIVKSRHDGFLMMNFDPFRLIFSIHNCVKLVLKSIIQPPSCWFFSTHQKENRNWQLKWLSELHIRRRKRKPQEVKLWCKLVIMFLVRLWALELLARSKVCQLSFLIHFSQTKTFDTDDF